MQIILLHMWVDIVPSSYLTSQTEEISAAYQIKELLRKQTHAAAWHVSAAGKNA